MTRVLVLVAPGEAWTGVDGKFGCAVAIQCAPHARALIKCRSAHLI